MPATFPAMNKVAYHLVADGKLIEISTEKLCVEKVFLMNLRHGLQINILKSAQMDSTLDHYESQSQFQAKGQTMGS